MKDLDLNEWYPVYTPPIETVDDFINFVVHNDLNMITPVIIALLFTWLIWLRTIDNDK